MSETKAAEPEKKSKKKLMIIILAAVLVLGGGGGAYFMFFASSAKAEKKTPEPGAVVVMDPITINLADGHYLKVTLALQASLDAAEPPDGSKALDIANSQFSELKMTQLTTAGGRLKAKKDLVESVRKAYKDEVYDIYFREFVMQ